MDQEQGGLVVRGTCKLVLEDPCRQVQGQQHWLQTGVAACTPVDVCVKLPDHPQGFLVCVDFVRIVPQLPYLLVGMAHNARTRSVTLRCNVDINSEPLYTTNHPKKTTTTTCATTTVLRAL